MRRAAFVAAVAFATLLGIAALYAFRAAVVLFVLSIVVGAALRPLVDRLVKEGWSLRLAIAAVYTAAVGTVVAIVFVLGAEIVVEVPTAAQALAESYEDVAVEWPREDGFRAFLAERLPPVAELYAAAGKLDPGGVARTAVDSSFGLLGLLGQTLIIIALAIYWSVERDAFERLWLSLLAVDTRIRARAVWTGMRVQTGAILRQELGQSLIAATALGFGFRFIDCAYWGLAALAVAVLRLVPLLGLPSSIAAAGLLGFATGPVEAALASGMTLVVLVALRAVKNRLFDAPRQNPILVILVVLGLAHAYGWIGIIAAPLVAAAIQACFGELVASRPAETAPATLDELRARAEQIDRGAMLVPLEPEVQSVVERMKKLLARAEGL